MASKRANAGDEQQKLSPSGLRVREIPGSYGVPFFSPLRDRLDYFYFQGAEEYFRSRIAKQGGATVLRVNMPPGPFLSGDSRVVAVLDARSFRVLLDDSRVDKDGTLDGTYMPSLALFGGHRPLAFLDGADPRHAALKRVVIRLAAARMHHVAPAFAAAFTGTFDAVEAELAAAGAAASGVEFNKHNMRHMLDFTCAALFGGRPPSKAIGDGAAAKAYKWLAFQLHPLASRAIRPWLLEDLLLHTFRLPPFLVRRDYADLTAYFADVAAGILDNGRCHPARRAPPQPHLPRRLQRLRRVQDLPAASRQVARALRAGAARQARHRGPRRRPTAGHDDHPVGRGEDAAGEVVRVGDAAHEPTGGVPVRARGGTWWWRATTRHTR